MKKNIFCLFSLIFSSIVYSQEYNLPFPDSSNVAWITSAHGGGIPEEFWSSYYRHYTNYQDTIYSDTSYHTLFEGSTNPNDFSTNNVVGFYRLDSLKMYFRYSLNDFNKEILLYNFGMQVGDTFYTDPNLEVRKYVLDSIDSIEIAGYFYRKFNFTGIEFWGAGQNYWIEGIGSDCGFFPFQNRGEYNVSLSCFYTNGHGISIDYNFEIQACDTTLGLNEDLMDNIIIYPNPVSDFITLEGDLSHCDFVLCDYAGKIVFQGKSSSTLDLSEFENGIYFLSLINGSETLQIKKIIKQ